MPTGSVISVRDSPDAIADALLTASGLRGLTRAMTAFTLAGGERASHVDAGL